MKSNWKTKGEIIRVPTQKDSWALVLISTPAIAITFLAAFDYFFQVKELPNALPIIAVFFWVFFILMWNFTYYEIGSKHLVIRMALFYKKKLDIATIQRIEKTNWGIHINGLSKNTLSVFANNRLEVVISPVDRDRFIEMVAQRKVDLSKPNSSNKP